MKLEFNNNLVDNISKFLQTYLNKNNLEFLTADQSAELLAKNNILINTIGPKPGFNFRQLLRDGRDGQIKLVTGAFQTHPRARWFIYKKIDELSIDKKQQPTSALAPAEQDIGAISGGSLPGSG